MAAPQIKIYLVPPGDWTQDDFQNDSDAIDETYVESASGWTPPSGFETCSHPRCAVMIERMEDTQYDNSSPSTNPKPNWDAAFYTTEHMVKMKPVSSGSRTFEIDYIYHDDDETRNFGSGTTTPWLVGRAFNGTIIPRKEFSAQGSKSDPPYLSFQVFLERDIDYMGDGQFNRSEHVQFVPQQGGYTANIDGDAPEGDTPWRGGRFWNSALNNKVDINTQALASTYQLNYIIDPVAKQISFSDYYYQNFVLIQPYAEASGIYDVYVRGYILRASGEPSQVWVNKSESYVYYALPHQDIVGDRGVGDFSVNGTPVTAELNRNTGIVTVLYNTSPQPATGYPCIAASGYWYHRWDRLANDDVFNLQFHGLYSGDTTYWTPSGTYVASGVQLPGTGLSSQYPYTETGDEHRMPMHQDLGAQGDDVPPNWYWAWADVKIINEGDSEFRQTYVDFVPRGILYTDVGEEQIIVGEGGLLNRDRPWDHQEGAVEETSDACFARVTRNWEWNGQDYEIRSSGVDRVAQWYNSSPTVTRGSDTYRYMKVEAAGAENLAATSQSANDDPVTLRAINSGYDPGDLDNQTNYCWARIIHTLKDVNTGNTVDLASGGKAWTLRIQGFYIRE